MQEENSKTNAPLMAMDSKEQRQLSYDEVIQNRANMMQYKEKVTLTRITNGILRCIDNNTRSFKDSENVLSDVHSNLILFLDEVPQGIPFELELSILSAQNVKAKKKYDDFINQSSNNIEKAVIKSIKDENNELRAKNEALEFDVKSLTESFTNSTAKIKELQEKLDLATKELAKLKSAKQRQGSNNTKRKR